MTLSQITSSASAVAGVRGEIKTSRLSSKSSPTANLIFAIWRILSLLSGESQLAGVYLSSPLVEGGPFSNSNCHSELFVSCHSEPFASCHSEPFVSCHSEPFVSCHSERSEESHGAPRNDHPSPPVIARRCEERSKQPKQSLRRDCHASPSLHSGLRLTAMAPGKREEPPEFRGALEVSRGVTHQARIRLLVWF